MTTQTVLAAALLAAAAGDASLILRDLPPPAGLVVSGEMAVYSPEKLWDHIDGAAQAYIDYGVAETATVSFQKLGAQLPRITVDLHRMAEPKGAFGIFSMERSGKGKEVEIGSGSSMEKGMLIFWKGDSYARIVSDASRDTTIALANALAAILPERDEEMPMLGYFLQKDRLPDGDGYTAISFEGIRHLNDIWTAAYADSAGSYRLLLRKNRPPVRSTDLPPKAKILASPKEKTPIQMIELGSPDQTMLLFYIKKAQYLAGYIGPRPSAARQKQISAWVEALPKVP
jgi:hypothetical protein